MAFTKGRDGVVKMDVNDSGTPEAVGWVQNWNLDETADTAAGWGMGDDYEEGFATISRWSGSIEVYIDAGDPSFTIKLKDKVALDLYPGGEVAGAPYYSGTAMVTGIPKNAAKDGIGMMTLNLTGQGPLETTTFGGAA